MEEDDEETVAVNRWGESAVVVAAEAGEKVDGVKN